MEQTIRLYHNTFAAKEIIANGFKDNTGSYMTGQIFTGVWFSADFPLDINEGADGDTVLIIDMPINKITDYEWIEEGKPYREFLIPAKIVNQYGPAVIYKEI